MNPRWLIGAALAGLWACGKGGSDTPPVPKPEAWPRVETYSAAYHPIPDAPLHFEVNQAVEVLPSERPGLWYSMTYPRYGATLFVTFTRASNPEERDRIVANRLERMQMNAGSGSSELTRLSSEGGFEARLLTTRHGSSTPVQLLAVGDGWVVSGAAALLSPTDLERPDSLAPVVDALEADMLHALKHLKAK